MVNRLFLIYSLIHPYIYSLFFSYIFIFPLIIIIKDKNDWVTLREHSNDKTWMIRNNEYKSIAFWDLPTNKENAGYQYFRIIQTGPNYYQRLYRLWSGKLLFIPQNDNNDEDFHNPDDGETDEDIQSWMKIDLIPSLTKVYHVYHHPY